MASGDIWGTLSRCTIKERCQFMYNNELLSDVKFVVRPQGVRKRAMRKIPAHKFILAISSPVFFAMFYGELPEKKDSIDISDCEYESLLEMFRFMYSDEVKLTPDNVMQVLYLAKKYLLPSLADKCTEYLAENLDGSNVFHVLPGAQKYEEKDLVNSCWKVIDNQTEEAVKSEGFVTIERLVLEELVERDSLNIKEVELFKAVDCWAIKECEKQGLAAEGSVKRRILGERIVKAIRFPVMEQEKFAEFVLDSDILTKKESNDLVKYYNSVLTSPVGFLEVKRVGSLQRICRFGTGGNLESPWPNDPFHHERIILSVDKEIKLYAVGLFGSKNSQYNVTLKVTNDCRHDLLTGTFLSRPVQREGGDYHGFDIEFKPPIILKAHSKYCFRACIDGPDSCYGVNGLSEVEHSGVKFVFTDEAGDNEYTNVSKGQFSEFEFTVV